MLLRTAFVNAIQDPLHLKLITSGLHLVVYDGDIAYAYSEFAIVGRFASTGAVPTLQAVSRCDNLV